MKKLITSLSLVTLLAISAPAVSADYVGTTPQPGQVITITKTIQDPKNNEFKKNLTVSDTHLLPGNQALFRVTIKNVSNQKLNNIVVTDTLPSTVEFVSASENFNVNGNTLTLTLASLEPAGQSGDTKTIDVKTKVKAANLLPADSLNCQTFNAVKAEVNNTSPSDTASFCFENQVLGVTTELPKTGPQAAGIILAGSASLFGTGLYLFKKSRKLMQDLS